MRKFAPKGSAFVLPLILAVLTIGLIFYFKFKSQVISQPPHVSTSPAEVGNLKSYISQDLKIMFEYPSNWFVYEKGYDILLTSYPTYFSENKNPTSEQIELFISIFPNCFPNYEQDLVYPACGEGGEESKNTIVSKESREVQAGTFYKYVIRTHSGDELIYYILYKDDKNILRIDKSPDSSQFEKEFEEIVNSIKFLD